jgi:tetratricopeptide (TPR) repeat protein
MAYWRLEPTAEFYEPALEIAERVGDRWLLAHALYNAAWSATRRTFPATLRPDHRQRLERSLALFEEMGDRAGMAHANWGLGDFDVLEGKPEEGRRRLETALELAGEVEDLFVEGWALYLLGSVARDAGDAVEAGRHFRASLRAFRDMEDVSGLAFLFDALAMVALMEGRPERAVRLEAAGANLRASTGARIYDRGQEAMAREIGSPLSEEQDARARSEGQAMTVEEAVAYALEDEQG